MSHTEFKQCGHSFSGEKSHAKELRQPDTHSLIPVLVVNTPEILMTDLLPRHVLPELDCIPGVCFPGPEAG